MNYFMTNVPLTFMEVSGQIDWIGWGFNVQQVQVAVSQGFQQTNGDKLVSILPIANEKALDTRLNELEKFSEMDESTYYKILSEVEAIAERDRLKAINDAAEELRKNTPTDDDIFKAQQLLLLTEISLKLGGTINA